MTKFKRGMPSQSNRRRMVNDIIKRLRRWGHTLDCGCPRCTAAKEIERLRAALENTHNVIPTNWCDPHLTGPKKKISIPATCPDVERLLHAFRDDLKQYAREALKAEKVIDDEIK